MDQWVETGRQVVDGVAGNRPGLRKKDNRLGLNDMGRWVGEKIDWFLEEEEDWSEPVKSLSDIQETFPIKKRPLTAISLRVQKVLSSSASADEESTLEDKWPEESSFKVDRWERDNSKDVDLKESKSISLSENAENLRRLPRSSRRRNNY